VKFVDSCCIRERNDSIRRCGTTIDLCTNFLGIPNEEYGFSNNARGRGGPASWEDAKFLFNLLKDTLNIRVD